MSKVERGKLILSIGAVIGAIAVLMVLLGGCAASKPISPEKWIGSWPQGIDCGVPITILITDGGNSGVTIKQEWIFPCWPEKNIPRCIKGCQP